MLTALVTRSTQAHQALMVGHLTNFDAPFQAHLAKLQQTLSVQSGQAAQSRASELVYQAVQQQAGLWAYIDNFRLLVPVCLVLVPIILLFKKTKHQTPAGTTHP
jgi:DHA2 family multidrug resistance protein